MVVKCGYFKIENKPIVSIGIVLILTVVFLFCMQFRNEVNQHPTMLVGNVGVSPLNDYRRYPCLPGVPVTFDTIRRGHCVRTILREVGFESSEQKSICFQTTLKVGKEVPMCTYDPKSDLISEYIHRDGFWEKDLVTNMTEVLESNLDMIFMDMGCNMGVYSLAAAKSGRRVISLDANYENLEMFSKSLTLGQLWENVTIIWNALSDTMKKVQLKLIKDNIGASRLGAVLSHQTQTGRLIDVMAIVLDDIQELVHGKKVFMKIDVERHELFVFNGAKEFFKVVDVRFVQMEMANTGHKLSVVEILESLGYSPYGDLQKKQKLIKENILKWPLDVYFIKDTVK